MLFRDFFESSEPIFDLSGRMSRSAFVRNSFRVSRSSAEIALVLTVAIAILGAWLGGLVSMMVGVVAGIAIGIAVQAVPLTALTIQRLHYFGWSAKVLLVLHAIIFAPLILFAVVAVNAAAYLERAGPWLFGCAFVGVATYIVLGWFMFLAEGAKNENQYGPPPNE